ncbi:MAG: hypothetical protein AAGB12_11550, partial [Pseudomonadota bacterium]
MSDSSILIVTTSFPQMHDGSEAAGSFVYDFALELSKHTDVTVMFPSLTSFQKKENDSFLVIGFKVNKLPLSTLKIYKPIDFLNIIKTIRCGNVTIKSIVSEKKITHIFALWVLP